MPWRERWRQQVARNDANKTAEAMDQVNPVYIARNHLVEAALTAATLGDMSPFEELRAVLATPFTDHGGLERYAEPAPVGLKNYQTFCGT